MKRFYEKAVVEPSSGGYGVVLDGRVLKTPAGAPLALPWRELAQAIAAEWDSQQDTVDPRSMPLSRLSSTSIDKIGPEREDVVAELLTYAGNDLLCYRVAEPSDLADRQEEIWQPLLDWAEEFHGVRLHVTSEITHIEQDEKAVKALAGVVESFEDLALTAVLELTAATGSLVLALAVAAGRIEAGDAFEIARLVESYQNEKWGEDLEAQKRNDALCEDILAAGRLLQFG